MSAVKMLAIVLIVAGSLGISYGSFTYTKSANADTLGPMEYSIRDTKAVYIPEWIGIGAIIAGMALLFVRND